MRRASLQSIQTMLSEHHINLLFQIYNHLFRCIAGCILSKSVENTSNMMWQFTQNCYIESASIHWCKVFGSYDEKTHFSKLFHNQNSLASIISKDDFKSDWLKSLNMTPDRYNVFHKEVMNARNKRFAHNDFLSNSVEMFDIEKLRESASEFIKLQSRILRQNSNYIHSKHEYILIFFSGATRAENELHQKAKELFQLAHPSTLSP